MSNKPLPIVPPAADGGRRAWTPVLRVLLGGIAAGGLLAVAASWTIGGIEAELRESQARELQWLLQLRVATLDAWAAQQKAQLEAVGGDPEFVRHIRELARIGEGAANPREPLLKSPSHAFLRETWSRLPPALAGRGYALLSPTGRLLDHFLDELVGSEGAPSSGTYIRRGLLGEFVLSRPYRETVYLVGEPAGFERPVLFVGGPIREAGGRIVALLALRFDAESGFAAALRPPPSGDLYVFDEKGSLLLGEPAGLRDPGGDLTRGFQPSRPAEDRPLTRMCASALSGTSGADASGYRSLRGREVLGAWTWLPAWEMGVAVERDLEEVLRPAARVRALFGLFGGLLAASTLGLAWAAWRFRIRRRRPDGGFGAYVLERRIGKEASAELYLARHRFLRRPALLRILRAGKLDDAALARFEREAQRVSRLGHRNTVQLYDVGRTPDGRLYLAMEYLEGFSFARLVALGGPLPPSRAVHLLRQVCGSLAEAHAEGLMHGDLKPANVMVCRQGGEADVVKVVDYGIAESAGLDPREDLHALGALAYLLVAGREFVEGPSEPPVPPLPEDLERLILACLSKDPGARPASAEALRKHLEALACANGWSPREALAWWESHEAHLRADA